MTKSIYIITPASNFPNYISAEILSFKGCRSGVAMADSASATVAALASKEFSVTICDEGVSAVDFDRDADWIAITGKVNQRKRMIAIADQFRSRGKRVIIGGPYASLGPAHLRDYCDVLVSGEIEAISDELFRALARGALNDAYVGDTPDISGSPVPDGIFIPMSAR